MNEGEVIRISKLVSCGGGGIVRVAHEHDFHLLAAMHAHGVLLYFRGRARHEDMRLAAQTACGQSHTLPVVAGRSRHHATGPLLRGELGHAVVRPAPLVRLNRAQVLALRKHGDTNPGEHKLLQRGGTTYRIHALACLQNFIEKLVS